jgi:hypothetical protein
MFVYLFMYFKVKLCLTLKVSLCFFFLGMSTSLKAYFILRGLIEKLIVSFSLNNFGLRWRSSFEFLRVFFL